MKIWRFSLCNSRSCWVLWEIWNGSRKTWKHGVNIQFQTNKQNQICLSRYLCSFPGGCCISPDNSSFMFMFSVYSDLFSNVNTWTIAENHIQTLDLVMLRSIVDSRDQKYCWMWGAVLCNSWCCHQPFDVLWQCWKVFTIHVGSVCEYTWVMFDSFWGKWSS